MTPFDDLAAAPIPVTIAGRQYRLSPLRYRDHAEAARRMKQQRPSPREAARRIGRGLPEALQRHLVELAYRDERQGDLCDLAELARWYRTPAGALVRKWLMLRRCHPELSLEDVDELLAGAGFDELGGVEQAAGQADGLPPGNSSSPPPDAAAGFQPPLAGSASFATSPASPDGDPAKSPT